ncbi:hypothetical protein PG988_011720 [Apiospora saccharicola]
MAEPSSISLCWLDNSVDAQIATSCVPEIAGDRDDGAGQHNQERPRPYLSGSRGQTDEEVLDCIRRQSPTRIWHPAGQLWNRAIGR